LQRVFIAPNVRVISAADLAEALEDELFGLRERLGPEVFPATGLEFLNTWAAPDKGGLRKFYRQSSDEPQFDLTPATEKAIAGRFGRKRGCARLAFEKVRQASLSPLAADTSEKRRVLRAPRPCVLRENPTSDRRFPLGRCQGAGQR
jgi:hypothetical protein